MVLTLFKLIEGQSGQLTFNYPQSKNNFLLQTQLTANYVINFINTIIQTKEMISQSMLSLFRKKLQNLQQSRQSQGNQMQSVTNHHQQEIIQHSTSLTSNILQKCSSLANVQKITNDGKNMRDFKGINKNTSFQIEDNNDKQLNLQNIPAQMLKVTQNTINEDFKIQPTCTQKRIDKSSTQIVLRNNHFGFRVCPSPMFPDTSKKLIQDNDNGLSHKSAQILIKKGSQKSQSINLDEYEIEQQINFTQKIPHLYFMNNLISLYGKVHPHLIRMYIRQLSKKHKIPYNDIIVSFGIEQIVAKFYQSHELQCQLTPKYILSQMSINIPPLIAHMCISNWSIIKKITKGAMKRFKIIQSYNDDWLLNELKKKGKLQRQSGNNMERILTLSKLEGKDINMPAHDKQVENANYKNMKSYLPKYEQRVYKQIIFQDTDEQLIEQSDRVGIQSKLKFYKDLKQKLNASKLKSKKESRVQKQRKQDQFEEKQHSLLNFFISCMMLKVPDDAIFLQQFAQQEDKSVSSSKSQRQGSKYLTLKQKLKQKQQQRNQRNQRQKKESQSQKSITAKKTLQSLPKISKTIQTPISVQRKRPQVLIAEPVTTPDKNQLQEWALIELDYKLFEFHQRHPDFSMPDLLKQIYRILKELKVSEQLYHKIIATWFNKYQKR